MDFVKIQNLNEKKKPYKQNTKVYTDKTGKFSIIPASSGIHKNVKRKKGIEKQCF